MRYFSIFSGIGGFEYGIGDMGECIGYSEIDKYAEAIYRYHYLEHKGFGDATEINTDELPDFDLLVGGFPCQSFSIAIVFVVWEMLFINLDCILVDF